MKFSYAGVETEYQDVICPHCGKPLEPWPAPPGTGWGIILVCWNNKCPHYVDSPDDILNRRDESHLGCRYAVNPDNGYKPFNLLAVCR